MKGQSIACRCREAYTTLTAVPDYLAYAAGVEDVVKHGHAGPQRLRGQVDGAEDRSALLEEASDSGVRCGCDVLAS